MSQPVLSEAEYDAITDAAAHWCMRLHESDCTVEERQAFEAWLKADPLHEFEYRAMAEIWDVADQLPRPELPETLASTVVQLPIPRPVQNTWRSYGVAAAISLLALPVAAYVGWNVGWVPTSYESYQADGNKRQVTLADGSRVELNIGTQLTYTHFKDRRNVTLSKGEAFFEVSHDTQHPFIVQAADGKIRVTGTKFNVWLYEDQVQVTLLEGSVQVSSNKGLPGDGFRLEPGMQARYKSGDFEPQLSQTYSNDNSLAWRNGKLVLDNLALADALPLINRYLKTPLRLADQPTGKIRIGGIYNTQDVNGLVASLPKVLPVYLTRDKDGNQILNSIPREAPKT